MALSRDLTRRGLLAMVGGVSSTLIVVSRAAAGSIPQKSVQYQTSPKDGRHCSLCKLFVPGATPDASGSCKSVAGAINPNGWCVLFVAKS